MLCGGGMENPLPSQWGQNNIALAPYGMKNNRRTFCCKPVNYCKSARIWVYYN